jgi:hypothetical protein
MDTWNMLVDPDSRLPLGSIIKDEKGEYAMIGYKKVCSLSKEHAEALLVKLRPEDGLYEVVKVRALP